MTTNTMEIDMNPKALIYCRWSTRPKKKELDPSESLEMQGEYCRRYFEFQGIEVDRVIGDPQTSARLVPLHKRPGGRQLLDLTTGRSPQFTIVGAYRLDRLFRDVVDGIQTLHAWDRSGVELHLSAQGGQSLNTQTATGRYIVNILLATAAHEADLTSERTKQADARHQDNGRIVGQLPYGRRHVPERSTLMVPDWDEQCTLAEMIKMAGEEDGFPSSRQVAKTLNRLGYKSRSGKPWHHEAVRRILKRPRLAQPEQELTRK